MTDRTGNKANSRTRDANAALNAAVDILRDSEAPLSRGALYGFMATSFPFITLEGFERALDLLKRGHAILIDEEGRVMWIGWSDADRAMEKSA